MLKTFRQITAKDRFAAGGKAYSLGRMIKHFPIPNGFVVLADTFDAFLHENQLRSKINKIIAGNDDCFIKSKQIKELIVSSPVNEAVVLDIMKHFARLKCSYVSVRSSAACEDAADKAWAGQLDTFLNTDKAHLAENIKLCWASLFSERAIAYGGDILKNTSIAVVVQQMVFADTAGVAFSVNPLNQNINEILINAVYGLGEAIVSGEITPDQYTVHKTGRLLNRVQEPQSHGLYQKRGMLVWCNIPQYKQNKPKLSLKTLFELCGIITKIEKFYNFPVDVEFAVKNQKIYILQARPITTFENISKDYRVPKVFERPSIPLFTQDGFEGLMGHTKLIEKYFKYPYVADLDVAAYAERHLCYSQKFTMECRDAYFWAYKNQNFSALFKIGRICRCNYRFYQKSFARYAQKIPSPQELENMLNGICHRMLFEMVFVDMLMDLSDIVSEDLLDLIQKKQMPNITENLLILSATEDLTRIECENQSMQIILEAARQTENWQKSPKVNMLIDKHLQEFSGITVRAMHGQFMTKETVVHRLEENLQSGKDFFTKNIANDKKAVQKIFKQYHFNSFEREFTAFVKEANFLRTHILDMYHWLSEKFMLIFDKIGQPYGYKGFDFRNMTPNEIILWYYGKGKFKLREDDKWLWYRVDDERKVVDTPQDIKRAMQQYILPSKTTDISADYVKGTTAYPGVVRGCARILKDIGDVKKVCRGDIIISPMTWPSVIVALEKAAAFVTDEGGILCHAAILARELKKTCVTGTKNATKMFNDGDMIEVDGETGTVRKL
ncbi:MAG: hypothetical protein J6N49_06905 [Alphaproteobacteria bacterium]|nr:hypothetical protein [Alphaproteobacteria bacterium]